MLVVALNEQQQVVGMGEVPLSDVTAARLQRDVREMRLAQPVTFIAVHHQPKGQREPSTSDWILAERLRQAADEIGVQLLDYFVFSRGRYQSLSYRGRLS